MHLAGQDLTQLFVRYALSVDIIADSVLPADQILASGNSENDALSCSSKNVEHSYKIKVTI
jgi:hypothetical protein